MSVAPLFGRVNRQRTRPQPKSVILVQRNAQGYLRGYQLADSWNLTTLAIEPTHSVENLRRAHPDFAFVLVSSTRTDRAPDEQWEAIGNPAGFLRTH